MEKLSNSDLAFFQRGQVAVSILLLMSVLVVISFSLAERTTNEVSLTTQTTESAAVFNAAETGVNNALSAIYQKIEAGEQVEVETAQQQIDVDGDGQDDVEVEYTLEPSASIATRLMEGMTLHLALNGNSELEVFWGREDNCDDRASIVVSVYSVVRGITWARHYPVTAYNCDRGDRFEAGADPGGSDFKSKYVLSLGSEDIFVRIKAVYNDTNIQASVSGGDVPEQAYVAKSRATNLRGDKQETRSLEVIRSRATAPSVLDYAVYSEGDLTKN